MIFGISTACFFLNLFNEDAIDQIGKMGIKNIEIFFAANCEYDEDYVLDIKRRVKNYGINVYSVHAFTTAYEPQLFSAHPRQQKEAYDIYKRVLKASEMLGAEVFVFHGPVNVKRAKKLLINYENTAKYVNEIANMAYDYGVKLAYETVHWCWYAKPDFAKNLREYITTDNLYFTLDIKQAAQSGYDPNDYIDDMGDRLVNIHICDYEITEEKGVMPVLPFKGECDFGALKRKLSEICYDKAMILEVYRDNYDSYDTLKNNYLQVVDFFSNP